MKKAFYAAALVALLTSQTSYAQEKCYQQVTTPAQWICSDGKSKSADFTEGCFMEPASVSNVEVACPKTAQWVPGNPLISQAEACAAYGMQPSNINGAVCQSLEEPAGTSVHEDWGLRLFEIVPGWCRDNACETLSRRVLNRDVDQTLYTCYPFPSGGDYDPTDAVLNYACSYN